MASKRSATPQAALHEMDPEEMAQLEALSQFLQQQQQVAGAESSGSSGKKRSGSAGAHGSSEPSGLGPFAMAGFRIGLAVGVFLVGSICFHRWGHLLISTPSTP